MWRNPNNIVNVERNKYWTHNENNTSGVAPKVVVIAWNERNSSEEINDIEPKAEASEDEICKYKLPNSIIESFQGNVSWIFEKCANLIVWNSLTWGLQDLRCFCD